jgi:hypothetical protein
MTLLSAVLLLMKSTVPIIFMRGKIMLLAMVLVMVKILLIIQIFVLTIVLLKMWWWVKLRQNILCQSKFECIATDSSADPNKPDVEPCVGSWPDCVLIARQSSSMLCLSVSVNVSEINKTALTCVSNVSKFKRTNVTAEKEQNCSFNEGRVSSCWVFIRRRPKAKYSSCVI